MDINNFLKKMEDIKALGWIKTHRGADTGVGKTLEDLLEIPENNIDLPDLGKTGELKAVRSGSSSLLTLFTLEPIRDMSWEEMLKSYGYIDSKGRHALKSTLSARNYNSQNLIAEVSENRIDIIKQLSDGNKVLLGYYDKNQLSQKFLEKISETLIYVPAKHRGRGADEYFYYDEVYLCRNFSGDRFLEVVESGDLYIDFRVHLKENGVGRSRGTALRIRKSKIDDFYETKERIL
ncbi:MvaI/BcnI family restriction endonuclease [Virgibacillus halodenitrificans]|uniref:MvaI/BcnI family restriction endonuclease n=1 Tax=Virgibacillus halodenitrificans TaxID=1482 RepID=UPI001F2E8C91|nr:MvaI/BcnI family restriction endonuclease [Virgibacillus halodenitrificans]